MKNDPVNRQEALDAMCDACGGVQAFCAHYPCGRYIAIENIPPAPSEHEWIPISEGLPDEFEVICCDNRNNMLIAHLFECDGSDTGYAAESDEYYMYNVVAWMPKPKPYKGKMSTRGTKYGMDCL